MQSLLRKGVIMRPGMVRGDLLRDLEDGNNLARRNRND